MKAFFDAALIDFLKEGNTITSVCRWAVYENINNVFSMIPLKENSKRPKHAQWELACTEMSILDKETLCNGNAGITCGPASCILVVDVDNHSYTREWLEERGLTFPLPTTLTVRTHKGAHFYYQYPKDGKSYGNRSIKHTVHDEVTGNKYTVGAFDIRGNGGYVVAPGSIHPETGKPYTITRNVFPAEAPEWVLHLALGGEIYAQMESPASDHESKHFNFNHLPISQECKSAIQTKHQKGKRSEAEWGVLCDLLAAGVLPETIHQIWETESIGEKNREHGHGARKRLDRQIEKARKHVMLGSKREKQFRCYSITDILKQKRQLEFLVEGLIVKNEAFMLLGDGGVGKSVFALNLALELADPSPEGFLGCFPVSQQAKSLILQSENSMASMTSRLQKIFGLEDMPFDEALEAIPRAISENVLTLGVNDDLLVSGNFMHAEFRKKVQEQLQLHKPDLVIIDPLISFHGEDENQNSPMRRVLDSIKDIAVSHRCTIGLIHHTGKNPESKSRGGGRGASSIGNWSRNSFEMVKRENERILFKQVKANDMKEMNPLEVIMRENLTFEVVRKLQTTFEAKDAMILKALRQLPTPSVSQKEFALAVVKIAADSGKTISESTAVRWIKASKALSYNKAMKTYQEAPEASES